MSRLKYIASIFMLLSLISAAASAAPAKIEPPPQYLNEPAYRATLDEVRDLLVPGAKTQTEQIWASLEFIHTNSIHKINAENRRAAFSRPEIMKRMLLAAKDKTADKPHLSCGPRSYLMRDILTRFHITSRLVQLFSDDFQNIEGHRLLEVFNSESARWEAWDPDYGVTYGDVKGNVRVDITALINGDLKEVIPQSRTARGWRETNTERLRDHYFESVLFETFKDGNEGLLNGIILVNPERFDIAKKFADGSDFQAWARKRYLFPRIVVLG